MPPGAFSLAIALSRPLAPGTVVECLPRHGHVLGQVPGEGLGEGLGQDDGRYVSLALRRFRFQTLGTSALPLLSRGETLFTTRNKASARFLAHGWAGLEDTHVWSLVERAELAFRAQEPAETLVLTVRGNPFLDGSQTLTVELNGTVAASATIDGRGEVRVPVAAAWRSDGANELALTVSALAQPPDDPRTLGLGLERLAVIGPDASAQAAEAVPPAGALGAALPPEDAA